jgi:hypothetical protein
MTDAVVDLSAYAQDAATAQDRVNILARITDGAAHLREAQGRVTDAEAALKAAQDAARTAETQLAELMAEARQDRLRTDDGWDLERVEKLRASIPAASLPQAIMWLKANGQAAVVKRELKLAFGMGEDQRAAEAVDTLVAMHLAPTDKQFVHPQTLEATLRELLAEGLDVPLGLFGAYVQNFVRMKPAKR